MLATTDIWAKRKCRSSSATFQLLCPISHATLSAIQSFQINFLRYFSNSAFQFSPRPSRRPTVRPPSLVLPPQFLRIVGSISTENFDHAVKFIPLGLSKQMLAGHRRLLLGVSAQLRAVQVRVELVCLPLRPPKGPVLLQPDVTAPPLCRARFKAVQDTAWRSCSLSGSTDIADGLHSLFSRPSQQHVASELHASALYHGSAEGSRVESEQSAEAPHELDRKAVSMHGLSLGWA